MIVHVLYCTVVLYLSSKVPSVESDTSQLFASFLGFVRWLQVFTILPNTHINTDSRQRSYTRRRTKMEHET